MDVKEILLTKTKASEAFYNTGNNTWLVRFKISDAANAVTEIKEAIPNVVIVETFGAKGCLVRIQVL